jgi:hypothetical protein
MVWSRRLPWLLAILPAVVPLAAGSVPDHRVYLVSQYDWEAKRGFYIDFENSPAGDEPCKLEGLKLILGEADGQLWRFRAVTPAWQWDRDYRIAAVLDGKGGELWLDGASQGQVDGGFVAAGGPLSFAETPDWANGPAEYWVRQVRARLTVADQRLEPALPTIGETPPPLQLFMPLPPVHQTWTAPTAQPVTIETTVRLVKRPRLRDLAPVIDRFGQNRYADFPGKITSEEQLRKEVAAEPAKLVAMGEPAGFDRYGGLLGAPWHEPVTGFYRLTRRNGVWWLLTPDGNPCFYLGVCTAPSQRWETTPVSGREWLFEWLPPKDGPLAAAWSKDEWGGADGTEYVCFHTANMARAYGDNWQQVCNERTARRLRAFGFGGIAKWGGLDGLPCTPVLQHDDVPSLAGHLDPWDPAHQAKLRESLTKQISDRLNDPMVIGWTFGSEYDEQIRRDEIRAVLAKPEGTPARQALYDYAREHNALPGNLGDGDIEALRRYYEDRYYALIYDTIKDIDHEHLYLGNWIVPFWWEDPEDWRIIARHCDAIGYDRYNPQFADEAFTQLIAETDKPVFCGEFSFPPTYHGRRGFGRYPTWAEDEADAGRQYAKWIETASKNIWCVAACWFEYRDQPLTGRGPGRGDEPFYDEHYAFGLVDVCDRPKWDLVSRMRAANLQAARRRLTLRPPL